VENIWTFEGKQFQRGIRGKKGWWGGGGGGHRLKGLRRAHEKRKWGLAGEERPLNRKKKD